MWLPTALQRRLSSWGNLARGSDKSCPSQLRQICPSNLNHAASQLTWITFLSVLRLGPIAEPISLSALQHAVTPPNILHSHSLPWENRRMTIFLGALCALHPCFFFWLWHIGARMTKHIMPQLLACSIETGSKFRWDAKVQFFLA